VPSGNATATVLASGWLVDNAPINDPDNGVATITVAPDALNEKYVWAQRPSQAIVTVLHTGTPIQGATVAIRRRGGNRAQYTGTTGANGQAVFNDLWVDTYDATASASGGYQSTPGTVTITAGNTTAQTTISLPGPATIIVVAAEPTGAPVPGASITCVGPYPGVGNVTGSPGTAGSDGTITFSGLVPGRYTLGGTASGHFDATASVTTTLAPDSTTTWTVTLPKIQYGNLRITVKNKDGTLATKGVSLKVTCAALGYTASPNPVTSKSGPDIGTVTLTNLQAETYAVTPATKSASPSTVYGIVTGGTTVDVVVNLTTSGN
jgi:hypothetical protein